METNWIDETKPRIDKLISKLEPAEVKRLQLEYLKTVVQRIDKESKTCEKCEYSKSDISEVLEILEKAEIITSSQRRAYNTRIKQVITHFKKVHGLVSATHYSNQFSMYGFIAGITMGIWFFDQIFVLLTILLLGPIIGKIVGGFQDYRNRNSDKLI